jgi:hypothetical protein
MDSAQRVHNGNWWLLCRQLQSSVIICVLWAQEAPTNTASESLPNTPEGPKLLKTRASTTCSGCCVHSRSLNGAMSVRVPVVAQTVDGTLELRQQNAHVCSRLAHDTRTVNGTALAALNCRRPMTTNFSGWVTKLTRQYVFQFSHFFRYRPMCNDVTFVSNFWEVISKNLITSSIDFRHIG